MSIIGYARSKLSDQDLREKLKPHLKAAAEVVEKFLSLVTYISGPYDAPEGFQKLNKALTEIEHKDGGAPSGRMFYLALPPSVYPEASCPHASIACNVLRPLYLRGRSGCCSQICQRQNFYVYNCLRPARPHKGPGIHYVIA